MPSKTWHTSQDSLGLAAILGSSTNGEEEANILSLYSYWLAAKRVLLFGCAHGFQAIFVVVLSLNVRLINISLDIILLHDLDVIV